MGGPSSLPQAGEWEVDLAEAPAPPETSQPAYRLLVVVDRETGLVRYTSAVSSGPDVTAALYAAVRESSGRFEPGRPEVIWCLRESMGQLGAAAAGLDIRLRATPSLPGVTAFLQRMARMSFEGIVPDAPERWRTLLRRAVDVVPWDDFTPDTTFHFVEGPPELQGRVAALFGETPALVVFGSMADHDRFLDLEDAAEALDVPKLAIQLGPPSSVPDWLLSQLDEAGLVTPEHSLTVMMQGPDETRPANGPEQLVCAAALEAVLAVIETEGSALGHQRIRRSVPTTLGDVTLLCTP